MKVGDPVQVPFVATESVFPAVSVPEKVGSAELGRGGAICTGPTRLEAFVLVLPPSVALTKTAIVEPTSAADNV